MDKELFDYLFEHKELITEEILDEVRKLPNGRNLALDLLDLPKDSEDFYLDAFGKRVHFDGYRNLKKPFTKLNLAPIHIKEIEKCAADIDYYRFNYVRIRTKSGIGFPEVRAYQKRFLDVLASDAENIALMFPRQSGKSATTAIYLSWLYLFKTSINIGICANRGSTAGDFLGNVKGIFYGLPIWMKPGTTCWNSRSIGNDRGVSIVTDATNENSFRGKAIHMLVVDEVAFIPATKFKAFADAILPTQSSLAWKKNVLISTPNGMNHFYEIVRDAKKRKVLEKISKDEFPDSSKILNTEKNSDGTYNVTVDEPSNGYAFVEVDWKEVPRYNRKGEIIDPEVFRDDVISKYGVQYFRQNFQCEFVGSAATLISGDAMEQLTIKRGQDRIVAGGHVVHVYDEPHHGHKYIFAIDPAKNGGDFFAMQLIDITKFPFKQVLSGNLKVDYLEMPQYIFDIGSEYNGALVVIENNEGAGQSIADTLFRDYEYSNLYFDKNGLKQKLYPGYRTTPRTRTQMLNTLKMLVENGKLEIVDHDTIYELERFVNDGKKFAAMEGFHDDLVMALAISLCLFNDINNFNDIKEVAEKVHSSEDTENFTDMITIGDFDDGVPDTQREKGEYYMWGNLKQA